METFITKVKVNKSRRVSDLEIPLSDTSRQHLFITGKNGSGKTSLLIEMNKFLVQIEENPYSSSSLFLDYFDIDIKFSNSWREIEDNFRKGEFLLAYFDAKRPHASLNTPRGIEKVELKLNYGLEERANSDFIQYIVNLKADKSFAKDDGEIITAQKLDDWFEQFERQLKSLFDEPTLKLQFDRKSYNFNIVIDNYEPFNLNQLSDGYSAIISIVTELLLRMEAHHVKSYDLEGVVLIDEIETHLHVELQKRVMPFLIDFFPKIQFIVTTHSPFVLSSVQNATICDLETRTITSDLSAYSYDALLESYFMTDKYSEIVKGKIAEYEILNAKQEKTIEDIENLKSLRDYFAHAPKYLSKELLVKLQQIELSNLNS
jgi:predicted ATP-dependent endonuclease of OLD family